jgi:hypothetical protein
LQNASRKEAMKLLDRARFGQTEVGSFVITIECSVAPTLQASLLDDDVDAPMERKAIARLAIGLVATQTAMVESLTSGGIAAFEKRTREGVSANLCDAIAEMLEATNAESVKTSFAFAANRPVKKSFPQSVTFTADSAGTLREAATQMRATTSYLGIELLGPVFKLQRDNRMGKCARCECDLIERSIKPRSKRTATLGMFAVTVTWRAKVALGSCTTPAHLVPSMWMMNSVDFAS